MSNAIKMISDCATYQPIYSVRDTTCPKCGGPKYVSSHCCSTCDIVEDDVKKKS